MLAKREGDAFSHLSHWRLSHVSHLSYVSYRFRQLGLKSLAVAYLMQRILIL